MTLVDGLHSGLAWYDPSGATAACVEHGGRLAWAVDGTGEATFDLAPRVERIVAFAPTFPQYALLHLGRAALLQLPVQSTRALLGVGAPGRRVWFYHYVRGALPADVRAWWDAREGLVRAGILHSGMVEDRLARFRRRMAVVRLRPAPEAVLELSDDASRMAAVRGGWDGTTWRAMLAWTFPAVLAALAGPYTGGRAVPLPVGRLELTERATRSLYAPGAGEDALVRWWLLGDWARTAHGPTWLTPGGYAAASGAVHRVEVRFRLPSVSDALEGAPDWVDLGLWLSSLPAAERGPVWRWLGGRVARGGRVVSWRWGDALRPEPGWAVERSAFARGGGPLAATADLLTRP